MTIEVAIERQRAIVVARTSRDIDAANAETVRMRLAEAVDERTQALVLDLSDSYYVDSAGIDMLFRLAALLADRRNELRIVLPEDAPLRRLAEIVGLPSVIGLDSDVEAAVVAVERRREQAARVDAPQ